MKCGLIGGDVPLGGVDLEGFFFLLYFPQWNLLL